MEESRKRPGNENGGESSDKGPGKPVRQASDGDGEDEGYDDIFDGFPIDEDRVNELMKLLEEEIASPTEMRFLKDSYSPPSSLEPSSFFTINGNEESCASSFSDSDCSVMASIDVSNIKPEHVLAPAGESLGCSMECGSALGKGEWEWDDEMFERFIGDDSSPTQ